MQDASSVRASAGGDEEFWDDLLAFIEDRRVVPVVGPELNTITVGGREAPLYRVLAEKLLEKYGLRLADGTHADDPTAVVLRPHLELNDAVCALAQRGRRVRDLYVPINQILRQLLGTTPSIPSRLLDLARIPAFDLFVTTTFDDLLAGALDQVANAGEAPFAERIAYAPNLPGERIRDLPEIVPSNYRAVLYLFGRASPWPFYAIDDEDVLEFVYNLQAERGNRPERMLRELRSCHLLLIGCNFSDWLSRFFIRLANQVRLSGDRAKKEFLVGDEAVHDRSLTLFLERFSHNTRVYPGDAREFVAELSRRWGERHPPSARPATSAGPSPSAQGAGEIFISYSRGDLAAAKALLADLDQVGARVIWLDKSALVPGDEWERQITAALRRCDLFLALVSGNTETRTDGYFHREWDTAVERSRDILGRTFIVPVVVDPTFDGDANRYTLVPERFKAFQYGHAPGGHMSEPLRARIVDAVRELRRRRTV